MLFDKNKSIKCIYNDELYDLLINKCIISLCDLNRCYIPSYHFSNNFYYSDGSILLNNNIVIK